MDYLPSTGTQADKAVSLLHQRGMIRLSEFIEDGITAATITRLERQGSIVRLSRGLYQLPYAPLAAHHALAEASKLVPRGVICLVSALAYHDLTDQVPPKIWMAIGRKDWKPRVLYPPIHFSRFPDPQLKSGVEVHSIEGIPVKIFGIGRTLADVFRYRRNVGTNLAIEGMSTALKQRKVSPSEIARYAAEAGVWKAMQPYLETLTFDG